MSSILYHIPGVRQLQTKLNQLSSYIPPPPRERTTLQPPPLRILLVHAHPNPSSFSAAIAQTVETAAKEAGHEIRRISLYEIAYDPKLTRHEHATNQARGTDMTKRGIHPTVQQHIKLLQWCDTLVFVYPTWWMNTPAVLKGFLDRTLVHDFCWALPGDNNNKGSSTGLIPKLVNITQMVGISTYGAPATIVTLAGDNGRRMMANAIRPICSPHATLAWLGLYGMDGTTHAQRTTFLQQVRQLVQDL